jgi:hypothetical protein
MPEKRLERTREAYQPDKAIDRETGISIRFIRQYDVKADQWPQAIDYYWPQLVCSLPSE